MSIRTIGTKTRGQMEQEWLKDFQRETGVTSDRPKGGRTLAEMAKDAGVSDGTMRRYMQRNAAKYEAMRGSVQTPNGPRATVFYVFKRGRK